MPQTVNVVFGKPSKFFVNGKRISVDTAIGLYKKKATFMSFGARTRSMAQYTTNKNSLLGKYGRDVSVYNITEGGRSYNRLFYPSTGLGNPRFEGSFAGLFCPMYGFSNNGEKLKKGMCQRTEQFPTKRPGLSIFPWQRDLIVHMLENSSALLKDIKNLEKFLYDYINTPGELAVALDNHIDDVTRSDFLQTSNMKAEIKEWLQNNFNIQTTDITGEPMVPLVDNIIYSDVRPSEYWKTINQYTLNRQGDERRYPRYNFTVRKPWMNTMDSQRL